MFVHPAATILLLGYDSLPILAEKSLFDLARWAQHHPSVREWLQDTAVDQIVARLGAFALHGSAGR